MPSEEMVTITKEQILARIAEKNEPPKLREAVDLAKEARDYFLNQISTAKSDREYIFGINGLRLYGEYKLISWMFKNLDKGETVTLNDLIADLEGHFGKYIESQIKALGLLRQKMANLNISEETSIAIVVKNSDIEPGIEPGHFVLAAISNNQEMIVDDLSRDRNQDHKCHLIFLYTNRVTCVDHACSTARKTSSDLGYGTIRFNIISRVNLNRNLIRDQNGVAQFVIGRDDEGKSITQDLENYLLCALALGIDDRVVRMSVPEKYD